MAYEEGLVAWDGRRETATVKLDLERAGRRPAVLFPVPADPRVSQVKAGVGLFKYLERATRPPEPEDGGGTAAAPEGVRVVSRRVIGAYDVAVFPARRAVYPMELSRASQVPVSLRLYVNSPHPVDATGVAGLRRVFDSELDELIRPRPPPCGGCCRSGTSRGWS